MDPHREKYTYIIVAEVEENEEENQGMKIQKLAARSRSEYIDLMMILSSIEVV
jgi:hypothetical protein